MRRRQAIVTDCVRAGSVWFQRLYLSLQNWMVCTTIAPIQSFGLWRMESATCLPATAATMLN